MLTKETMDNNDKEIKDIMGEGDQGQLIYLKILLRSINKCYKKIPTKVTQKVDIHNIISTLCHYTEKRMK